MAQEELKGFFDNKRSYEQLDEILTSMEAGTYKPTLSRTWDTPEDKDYKILLDMFLLNIIATQESRGMEKLYMPKIVRGSEELIQKQMELMRITYPFGILHHTLGPLSFISHSIFREFLWSSMTADQILEKFRNNFKKVEEL